MTNLSRVLLAIVFCAAVGLAQEFRATISGHVLDSSGSAVPNATIQAVNVANSETAKATSDSSGTYSMPFLRPGVYKLTATALGFKQYIRENVTLEVGRIVGIDIALEVGAVTESINVTADAALLETQTASRTAVISTRQVADMPLNSRNPFMLGAMMSGVTFRGAAIWQRPFDNGAIAEWSVNGGRQSNNEFLMDGAPNNGQGGNNNIAYVPIVDAVQEFSVQQNSYNAEYGKTGGGVFNVVLKSGTNTHHITAWEYMRRKFLDANAFQNNSVGSAKPAHRLDQYGFQLEGPVYLPKLLRKDGPVKLFYLGSFEDYYEKWPQFLRNSYPFPEQRTGDFSKLYEAGGRPVTIYDPFNTQSAANGDPIRLPFAGNIIPASRIHPVAKAVTGFMPLPNSATPGGMRYASQNHQLPEYAATDNFYNLILKFDWNFGDKHRSFVRHASNDRTEDRCTNGICDGPGQSGQQPFQRINDTYVVDWISTLSPSLVLNVRASHNRFIEKGFGRANTGFDLTSLGLPSSLISQLPQPAYFGVWGINNYSGLGRAQSFNFTNNYGLMGSVTKIAGSHTLKLGLDIRRIHFNQQNTGNILNFTAPTSWTQRLFNQGEAISGDGYASFLLGIVTGEVNYNLFPANRWWYMSPFFQDDWKVNKRLTLNLGFRWDYNGPPDEKYNRLNRSINANAPSPIANQIPAAMLALYPHLRDLKGGLEFAGINGNPRGAINKDWNNFQPRIGVALKLTDKTVMRGGYGLYYMNPNNNSLQTAGFSQSTPIITSQDGNRTPVGQILSNPFPTGIQVPPGAARGYSTFYGQNTNFFDPTFVTPYVHQFSFGFQHQVSQTATLDVSYVGSRTVGANDERAFNIPSLNFRKQCNLLEGGSPAFCDALVPNPFQGIAAFQGTNYFTAPTISRYNANRVMPQFTGDTLRQGLNTSNIWYNSVQINYNQRIGNQLTMMANYTRSKMVERFGYNDPFAGVNQQGLYFNDRPHILKVSGIYELPFGRNKKFGSGANGVLGKLIGGWEITGYYNHSSGEPNDLPGNVIPLKDPRTNMGWDGVTDWKAHQVRGWSPCVVRQFNDGSLQATPGAVSAGCGSDLSQYVWLWTAGYAPRVTPSRSGQIRKHKAFTFDGSLLKNTQFGERVRTQLGFEFFNAFNHYFYGRNNGFNTDPNSPNFGTQFPNVASDQNGYPRQIQIRLKFIW